MTMEQLETIRDALGAVVMVLGFVGAVLMLALVDVGFAVLLIRCGRKVKRLTELPQPGVPLPQLPPDHKVVVLGGGVRKKW
jgi:hypothetical protein